MTRALTVGETMALLDPIEDGEIWAGTRFQLRVAGAESNFGIALSRLGVAVTWMLFDPNYRAPLWSEPEEAAAAQREVLPSVDWYLCGLEEGNLLLGTETAEELAEAVRAAGAHEAVVRVGARGAFVQRVEVAPPRLATVLDEVGAGDGFAAGFAYGLLQGWEPAHCARAGNVIAAAALAGTGDWETFPRLEEIEEELRP